MGLVASSTLIAVKCRVMDIVYTKIIFPVKQIKWPNIVKIINLFMISYKIL
jgi:hypothetical protein